MSPVWPGSGCTCNEVKAQAFADNRWQPIGVLAKTRRNGAYYQGIS